MNTLPEAIHLFHVVQGDHAISQEDVQQAVGVEQKLASQVLPMQLSHLHQHPHGPSVHLVWVLPANGQPKLWSDVLNWPNTLFFDYK